MHSLQAVPWHQSAPAVPSTQDFHVPCELPLGFIGCTLLPRKELAVILLLPEVHFTLALK